MMLKVWAVLELGEGDKLKEVVGVTSDEDFARGAVRALTLIDKVGLRYKKVCVDYREP